MNDKLYMCKLLQYIKTIIIIVYVLNLIEMMVQWWYR